MRKIRTRPARQQGPEARKKATRERRPPRPRGGGIHARGHAYTHACMRAHTHMHAHVRTHTRTAHWATPSKSQAAANSCSALTLMESHPVAGRAVSPRPTPSSAWTTCTACEGHVGQQPRRQAAPSAARPRAESERRRARTRTRTRIRMRMRARARARAPTSHAGSVSAAAEHAAALASASATTASHGPALPGGGMPRPRAHEPTMRPVGSSSCRGDRGVTTESDGARGQGRGGGVEEAALWRHLQ